MKKPPVAKIFKVLAVIVALLLGVLVLLTLPECCRIRAMIINNSRYPVEGVTLTLRDQHIWSGGMGQLDDQRICVPQNVDGVFDIKGQYTDTGEWFAGYSGYVYSYDERIHLLLIEDDGIRRVSWRDPPRASAVSFSKEFLVQIGALFLRSMSCLDYHLYREFCGEPEADW